MRVLCYRLLLKIQDLDLGPVSLTHTWRQPHLLSEGEPPRNKGMAFMGFASLQPKRWAEGLRAASGGLCRGLRILDVRETCVDQVEVGFRAFSSYIDLSEGHVESCLDIRRQVALPPWYQKGQGHFGAQGMVGNPLIRLCPGF